MVHTSRFLTRSLILAMALMELQGASAQEALSVQGFTPESATRPLELEGQYDSYLDADNLEEWMRYIVSKPIYTGSPHNRETAYWMVEQFESWGFEVRLDEYQVLYQTPRIRELELIEPTSYTAQLREPTLAEDETSGI